MLTVADVIFPAFYAPYVAQIFLPFAAIAALASEVFFYRWWSKEKHVARLVAVVLVANVVSSIAGIVIAVFLPTGYNPAFVSHGQGPWHSPAWNQLAEVAWVVAFLASVFIEWPIVAAFHRLVTIPRTFLAVLLANAVSYVVLLVVFFGSVQASR